MIDRRNNPTPAHRPTKPTRAFTLVELLVVMSIIVLLLAIGVPSVTALMNSGKLSNARQTVMSGVSVARAIATAGGVPDGEGAFAGAAAVMAPEPLAAGDELVGTDLRIVRHERFSAGNPIYDPADNASVLSLPSGTAAVGIFRNAGGMALQSPPFAVRFDAEGVLIPSASNASNERAIRSDLDADGTDEILPSAIGIVVFKLEDLKDAGFSIDVGAQLSTGSDTAGRWIRDNGRHLLFNRYSGVVLSNP